MIPKMAFVSDNTLYRLVLDNGRVSCEQVTTVTHAKLVREWMERILVLDDDGITSYLHELSNRIYSSNDVLDMMCCVIDTYDRYFGHPRRTNSMMILTTRGTIVCSEWADRKWKKLPNSPSNVRHFSCSHSTMMLAHEDILTTTEMIDMRYTLHVPTTQRIRGIRGNLAWSDNHIYAPSPVYTSLNRIISAAYVKGDIHFLEDTGRLLKIVGKGRDKRAVYLADNVASFMEFKGRLLIVNHNRDILDHTHMDRVICSNIDITSSDTIQ